MEKKIMLWIVIGIMFLAVIFLTFKTASLSKTQITGGAVDTTGWTEDEKMNYEMHGTLPARLQGKVQQQTSGGMVGGC